MKAAHIHGSPSVYCCWNCSQKAQPASWSCLSKLKVASPGQQIYHAGCSLQEEPLPKGESHSKKPELAAARLKPKHTSCSEKVPLAESICSLFTSGKLPHDTRQTPRWQSFLLSRKLFPVATHSIEQSYKTLWQSFLWHSLQAVNAIYFNLCNCTILFGLRNIADLKRLWKLSCE